MWGHSNQAVNLVEFRSSEDPRFEAGIPDFMNGILNFSIHFNVVHRKVDWRNPMMKSLKGIATSISPDRTRLISILLSNSRLPGHLSPDLWHSMLIILILLIHATTRQQWNASWQSKRRRSAQILSTAIVTVALATRTGMKRVGTRADGRRCHVPVWKRWNTASYIFGSRMLRPSTDIPARIILP